MTPAHPALAGVMVVLASVDSLIGCGLLNAKLDAGGGQSPPPPPPGMDDRAAQFFAKGVAASFVIIHVAVLLTAARLLMASPR